MKIYSYTPGQKTDGKRVTALGFFDGVHLGHRALIARAKRVAEENGIPMAVFTFSSESFGKKGTGRIYSTEEKLEIIEKLGADEVIIADFSSVMNISAKDFVLGTLTGELGTVFSVCGADFRYGKGAEGDAQLLARLMREGGGDCVIVSDETLNGKKVSTTAIKDFLRAGDMQTANALLGEPLFVSGVVERGLGLGKSLGFPTVNTPLGAKSEFLRRGVYRSEAEIDGVRKSSITNLGSCPTVGEREIHLESYILDGTGDIYGKKIKIFLLEFLRDEKRFESKNDLIMQINVDINRIKDGKK